MWARVTNPNPFGFTLGTLKGTLYLDDSRAADADFPLGLPLGAMGDTVIPIDISISFADLPGLSNVARRVIARQPVAYRLEGTIGVDAGRLGQPVFGPMTLLSRQRHRPASLNPKPSNDDTWLASKVPTTPGASHLRASHPDGPEEAAGGGAIGAVRMQATVVRLRAEPEADTWSGWSPARSS